MPGGRPRGFDRDAALEKAMRVFWQFGYEGASLDQLRSAMGIAHTPSLFKAFGNKERFFRAATDLYWQTYLAPRLDAFAAERDVETGSQTLLESLSDLYTGQTAIRGEVDPAPLRGCLVLTSALNCTPQNGAVAAWSAGYRARMWEAVTSRLQRAAFEKEIGEGIAETVADLYATFIAGMALRARDQASRNTFTLAIDILVEPLRSER